MILVLVVARSIGDPLEPVYEKAGQGFGLSRVHVSNYDWTEEKPNILVLSKHILGQPPYQKKTRNELKASYSNTYRLKNEERTKNDEKSSRKCLGSVTEAPQLGFSSRKHVFSPKTA